MTTPLELSRKVAAYLERTCPPPGAMRWQDYLTGDGEADMPVLCAAATALGLTVHELLDAAVAYRGPVADVTASWSPASAGDVCLAERAKTAKRVAARFRRSDAVAVTMVTCAEQVNCAQRREGVE